MTTITNYAINVDLHRLMVTTAPSGKSVFTFNTIHDTTDLNLLSITHHVANTTYRSGNFVLTKAVSNDNAYHLQFNIEYNGKLFGNILTNRTKKYGFNLNLMPLRIENEILYSTDYSFILSEFLTNFNLVVSNHSQLDIAIDTQDADLAEIILSYTTQPELYKRIKKANDKPLQRRGIIDEVTGIESYTTTLEGSRVSVKMYNKTEQLTTCNKPYISEYFTRNSFDESKPVYRVELSIYAKALKSSTCKVVTEDGEYLSLYKYNQLYNSEDTKGQRKTELTPTEIEINKLSDKDYLVSLFKHFFPIDIKRMDQRNISRCKSVKLIDFDEYILQPIKTITIMRNTIDKLIMEKRSIKDSLTLFKKTRNPIFFKAAAIASNYNQLFSYTNELINTMNINKYIFDNGLHKLLEDTVIENAAYVMIHDYPSTQLNRSTICLFNKAA